MADTDVVIDVLSGNMRAVRLMDGLIQRGLAISLITYGELYEGALYGRDSVNEIRRLNEFVHRIRVIDLTQSTMERFATLRGELPRNFRQQLGDFDLLIAATAIEHRQFLITGNVRDFQHVRDLRFANHRTYPIDGLGD